MTNIETQTLLDDVSTRTVQAEVLEKMTVITKDGRELGKVRGVDIDIDNWNVRALAVRLEKSVCEDFGVEPKLIGSYTVHVRVDHVAAVGDTVLLNATLKDLEEARDKTRTS